MKRSRRALTTLLVVLVLPLAAAACGNDDGDRVQSGRDRGGSTTSDTSPSSYVGLSKKAAIAKADANDVTWRILREDDEQFPATMDFNPERINFEIDNGKVTKATLG